MSTEWMRQALAAARLGLGRTAPNPAVGAVIEREGRILGIGTTQPWGQSHAEPMAIRAARDAGHDLRGATLHVTLEPCCHHGRTPPCTDAILAAGIARVVIGAVDPFPAVRGRGIAQLRSAGVEVDVGVLRDECETMIRGFARSVSVGLPEVTAKVAASVDGCIAAKDGSSQWITGSEARAYGHTLRAEHDAILVGIDTVVADNPRLTCRVREGRDPRPVILDTRLRIPSDAAVFQHPRRPVILAAHDAPERALPADIVRVARGEGGVDVEAALRALVSLGIHRVLVEGGAKVHRRLLDAGLVDELLVFLGSVLIPGGRPWLGGEPVPSLSDAVRLGAPSVLPLGEDVLLRYAVRHRFGRPAIEPAE